MYGCHNYTWCKKLGKLHFYRFLKTKSLVRQWIHACRRKDKLNPDIDRVCSYHFKAKSNTQYYMIKRKLINKPPQPTRSLRTEAVPFLILLKQENDPGEQ